MAIHDLHAQHLGLPLVDVLGRAHDRLPTSVTIGIKPLDETLAEADEYVARGFRALKLKVGRDLEGDLERVARVRERVGPGIALRADANQGYDLPGTRRFLAATAPLDLELVEQPVPAAATRDLCVLDDPTRARLAADESVLSPAEALALAAPPAPCGIFNVKLMKCGGIAPALSIADLAALAGIRLMWGCNDESRIGITAALHAALAAPATAFLDLDGSFDLARDIAEGGFVLEDGQLRTGDEPGLGLRLSRDL
jgi:L-alanine-DL-glutamate epimerase-like enolase superfamily enzyme